ncbi:MAG: hypothetical protein ACI9NC_003607, partial [Verrucomicrobiales bacterium]
MKKLIIFIAAVFAVGLLAPIAQAGTQRRVVGYNQCGDALYATYRVTSYQRCGTPNYGWIRDRCTSGCTRPGRCNHHGHAHSTRSVYSRGNSRLTVGHAPPRVSPRSSSSYRGSSYRGSSYRGSSYR